MARAALPLSLLLPTGFAVVVVVSSFTTLWPQAAPWTVPIIVVLAATGLVLTRPRWPGSEARGALAVAAVTFLVFGAPVIATGDATFAGYVKLDDTATFLALTDRALEHGRDLTGLAPSSYEAALTVNLANGYPLGALVPLGVGAKLVGTDPAWVWQPFIAVAAALLAMTLYALSAPLICSRVLRASVAVVASQAALLYGYALWGGSKEVIAATLLALGAATIPYAADPHGRGALVPAIAWAALLAVNSLAAALWVVPLALAALVWPGHERARRAPTLILATGLLSLPTIVAAPAFLRTENASGFRSGADLGNLAHPLPVQQVLGVWPAGDFRFEPDSEWTTAALLVLVAVALAVGVIAAARHRAFLVLTLVGSTSAATAIVVAFGSPWVAAKALAIASPIMLFTAACGCALLLLSRRGVVAGAVLAGALVAGVASSNVLAYRAAWLAPASQLAELATIGERYAGQSPALMTEYQPYGVRHFLRHLDAEGTSELRRRAVLLRTGRSLARGEYADIDGFELAGLHAYRTLVLRRSPLASRPPSTFSLSHRGTWYDVWTRGNSQRRVLAHLPVGSALDPLGRASCADVRALALVAKRAGGELVVPRTPESAVAGIQGSLPPGWTPVAGSTGRVLPGRDGTTETPIVVPDAGGYALWVRGSVRGRLRALLDGTTVGEIRDHINPTGMWLPLGVADVDAGTHTITLEIDRDALRPGGGGEPFEIGPVALTPDTVGTLRTVDPARASELCGVRLDWVEAAAP